MVQTRQTHNNTQRQLRTCERKQNQIRVVIQLFPFCKRENVKTAYLKNSLKGPKAKWEENTVEGVCTRNSPLSYRIRPSGQRFLCSSGDLSLKAANLVRETVKRTPLDSVCGPSSHRESPKWPHHSGPSCHMKLLPNPKIRFMCLMCNNQSLNHWVWSRESFIIRRAAQWEGRELVTNLALISWNLTSGELASSFGGSKYSGCPLVFSTGLCIWPQTFLNDRETLTFPSVLGCRVREASSCVLCFPPNACPPVFRTSSPSDCF